MKVTISEQQLMDLYKNVFGTTQSDGKPPKKEIAKDVKSKSQFRMDVPYDNLEVQSWYAYPCVTNDTSFRDLYIEKTGDIAKLDSTQKFVYYDNGRKFDRISRKMSNYYCDGNRIVDGVKPNKKTTKPQTTPKSEPTFKTTNKFGKKLYDGTTMSPSDKLFSHLKEHEGDAKNRVNGVKEPKYKAYKDAGGTLTIGYGHTANVKPTDVLKSREEGLTLLRNDVEENVGYIRKIMEKWKRINTNKNLNKKVKNKYSHMLTQGQFDTLVSLSFHSGIGNLQKSQLLKELKKGNLTKVVELLKNYRLTAKGQSNALEGIIKRRQAEINLFNS
jgi:lysozyme